MPTHRKKKRNARFHPASGPMRSISPPCVVPTHAYVRSRCCSTGKAYVHACSPCPSPSSLSCLARSHRIACTDVPDMPRPPPCRHDALAQKVRPPSMDRTRGTFSLLADFALCLRTHEGMMWCVTSPWSAAHAPRITHAAMLPCKCKGWPSILWFHRPCSILSRLQTHSGVRTSPDILLALSVE
jgi:hypothetical protein